MKNKSKSPKKKCGELKAKVRELRKEARAAMEKNDAAKKKYKKKLKKLVAELEPFKVAALDTKKAFRQKKKAYLKAKDELTDCLNPPKKKEEKPKKKKKKKTVTKVSSIGVDNSAKVEKKAKSNKKPKAKKAQRVEPLAERKPANKTKTTTTNRAPYAVPSVAAKVEKTPAEGAKKAPVNPRKSGRKTTKKPTSDQDNLKKIEGIGPKIESLLKADGINTFKELSKAKIDRLEKVLLDAGPRFRMHKPTTWPEQAGLAAAGDWDALKQLQDVLKGGKR